MMKQRIQVLGMHCVGCAMTVDGTLEDLMGVKSANTNYARQYVEVEYDECQVTAERLIEAIKFAGFKASLPAVDRRN